jgi:hypothetical protein
MGWDAGSRASLRAKRSLGVVAVRYHAEGCNVELEVLSNCIGTGTYTYLPYSSHETKIVHDSRELYAELPIGAARLGGKLLGHRALRTDYMIVGMEQLPVVEAYRASDLRGPDCDRATHVVSLMYLGGFAMVAGDTRTIEAAASVFGAGAGGAQEEGTEHVAREGVAEACSRAETENRENDQCAVPLRLGLLPIAGRAPGGCAVGWSFDGHQCVPRPERAAGDAPVSDAERASARELFGEGYDLQRQGRFAEALDKFARAQAIFSAPTNMLHLAECQAALGKLLEAAESYRLVVRTPLPPGSPPAFQYAVDVAKSELAQVEPRVPRMTVRIEPAGIPDARIEIDGRPLSSALIGVPVPHDPGMHAVRGLAAGYVTSEQTVTLEERDFKTVSVSLRAASEMAVPGPTSLQCRNDLTCGTHHCNVLYGKCAFPCQSAVDCVSPNQCVSGLCVPGPR